MIFVVDNLGPVNHAEIDLSKRLIVFAGPNHSGKTHVAWAIYGVIRRISAPRYLEAEVLAKFAQKLIGAGSAGVPIVELAGELEQAISLEISKFARSLEDFFVAPGDQYRDSSITVRLTDLHLLQSAGGCSLEVQWKDGEYDLVNIEGSSDGLVHLRVREPDRDRALTESVNGSPNTTDGGPTPADLASFVSLMMRILAAKLYGMRVSPAIFPTERTAINLFARELASARLGLVDRLLQAASEPEKASEMLKKSARRYAEPLLDCIRTASDLAALRRDESEFLELAQDLERLLGGVVDVTDDGDIGFTPAHGGRPRVPFHVSASVVKSLASLVFFFRHQAKAGATLVIDEPELNLHPDLQRKVARFLAKAVNAGFRIILSTHSDYLLREFSNLVRLGAAGKRGTDVATELGYDTASILEPDVVGVWHFDGGRAEQLKISGEGFSLSSIEDVIEQQNLATQQIEVAVG